MTTESILAPTHEADPFRDLMVPIKGGSFDMGDTFGDGFDDEKPVHRVTVPDFLLCKYPVTQAQWKQIMGENPSHFKGDYLPVEWVSWDDAQAFLEILNRVTNMGYRLPTEAEWEYAAKGGSSSRMTKYSGSNDLDEVGWYWENSGNKRLFGDWGWEKIEANNCHTHPVGRKKPNELGLYDMSGNVWEWCFDRYAVYPSSSQTKPTGSTEGADRVLRGGSWYYGVTYCRVTSRYNGEPARLDNLIGFRVALAPQSVG